MLLPPTAHALWKILHTFAAHLPPGPLSEREQAILRSFLCAFADGLTEGTLHSTCACSENWQQHLTNRPPVLTTRQTFQQWAYDIHNDLNALKGKPILPLHAPDDPS